MLLFLHGFLGCKEDWNPVLEHVSSGVAIDLPLFETDIAKAIFQKVKNAQVIVGYSAGGRIALEMKTRFPDHFDRVIAISTHPGLPNAAAKEERRKQDQVWIDCLENEPYPTFLQKWYDQPLFATLKSSKYFATMLERRKQGDPKAWAHFLRHHGLGQKPTPKHFSNTLYFWGSEDLKYGALYRKLSSLKVKNCGHAVHLEQPKECARMIKKVHQL